MNVQRAFAARPIPLPVRWPILSLELGCAHLIPPFENSLESSLRHLEVYHEQSKRVHYIKVPLFTITTFLFASFRIHSTAKEIVKSGTPRWLVATVALKIRILLGSYNWAY